MSASPPPSRGRCHRPRRLDGVPANLQAARDLIENVAFDIAGPAQRRGGKCQPVPVAPDFDEARTAFLNDMRLPGSIPEAQPDVTTAERWMACERQLAEGVKIRRR
ncbi:hypothetical protein [Streptomyces griseus]